MIKINKSTLCIRTIIMLIILKEKKVLNNYLA